MDDRTILESALFAHLESKGTVQELHIHPNFSQGINAIVNGVTEYSIQPGVSTEGASLIDGDTGEKIASIRESVHGRVVYDMGGGETAVSRLSIFDSSVVQGSGGDVIGYTSPAFPSGMEVHNSFKQSIVGMDQAGFTANTLQVPEFTPVFSGNTFDGASSAYDALDVVSSLDDVSDATDILDAMDLLGDIF